MSSPIDKIIDWNLDKLPKDPLTQTRYMYYLQSIILFTLIGFTINNLYLFYSKGWAFNYLLGAILTTVFTLMSLFSYKQIRTAYKSLLQSKDLMGKAIEQTAKEITPEMIEKIRKSQKTEKTDGKPESKPKSDTYIG